MSMAAISPAATVPPRPRLFASPLSRALARQHDLDLSDVPGSGPQGRILKADVLARLDSGRPAGGAPRTEPPDDLPHDLVPNPIGRKLIARRLTESLQQAPHFYARIDVLVDPVLQLRSAWPPEQGDRPSINDYVVQAAAQALREVPGVNASYTEAAIRRYRQVHIAVAVAVQDGLRTPVVRDADTKPLAAIAREMRALAAQAREGRLSPEASRAGTFSISNLGALGVREFTAVINPPQAAILAVGAAEPRPVVRDGGLAIATVMTVVLSADHRLIDGALAAQWLAVFRRHFENPARSTP